MPKNRSIGPHTDQTQPWLLFVGLLLAFVAYWPALHYGFVFDDLQQIVQNRSLQSWSHLPGYFTENVWAGVYPGQTGSYYRPLFLVWFRLNYILFETSPAGWHFTNLLVHLAVIWMLFLLIRRWTGDATLAGWAALLFSVHPAHLEAVAWISAAPEALFTLAGLSAVYLYLRYLEDEKAVLLPASAGLYAIALFTKETAIALWPVIAACEGWRRKERKWRPTALRMIPFAAITCAYLPLRLHALHGFAQQEPYTLTQMLRIWPSLAWFYLKKLALPTGLAAEYDNPWPASFLDPQFFLPVLLLAGTAVVLVLWARKSKAAAFGALLLVVALLPPLAGVWVFPPHDLVHDRYLYLPSAGYCLLLALVIQWIARETKSTILGTVVAGMIALSFTYSTRAQEWPFRDNGALFARATQVAAHNPIAWGMLGEELMTNRKYPQGIHAFQQAQAMEPDMWLTNYRLGAAYYLVRQMPLAEMYFQRAADNHHGRESLSYDYTLYRLALSQYAQAKMAAAETNLRQAIERDPNQPGYHLALAGALKYQGRMAEARRQLDIELKLGPNPEASQMLAEVESAMKTR